MATSASAATAGSMSATPVSRMPVDERAGEGGPDHRWRVCRPSWPPISVSVQARMTGPGARVELPERSASTVQRDDAPGPGVRGGSAVARASSSVRDLFGQRLEQFLLVGEVQVEGPVGGGGELHDVVDPGGVQTTIGEDGRRPPRGAGRGSAGRGCAGRGAGGLGGRAAGSIAARLPVDLTALSGTADLAAGKVPAVPKLRMTSPWATQRRRSSSRTCPVPIS